MFCLLLPPSTAPPPPGLPPFPRLQIIQACWLGCIAHSAARSPPSLCALPPLPAHSQIFQAYMLLLAEAPGGEWGLPEDLLALGQNAWVQSTKRIT